MFGCIARQVWPVTRRLTPVRVQLQKAVSLVDDPRDLRPNIFQMRAYWPDINAIDWADIELVWGTMQQLIDRLSREHVTNHINQAAFNFPTRKQ